MKKTMRNKWTRMYVALTTLAVAATPILASDPTADEQIKTALQTSFTKIASDMMGVVVTALPIGLGIIGAVFGIKKGISFFKTIANKA
ncbi:MAG: hypothetical protein RR744_10740 [Cellulosilyticaceae bacterium]|uniref:hypothetical protein n=1 Tax=Niameybacter sp. TaxID=2033640 RepID=UPI002FC77489